MNDLERVARKIHEHSGMVTPYDDLTHGARRRFVHIAREVLIVLNHPLPKDELVKTSATRFPMEVVDLDELPSAREFLPKDAPYGYEINSDPRKPARRPLTKEEAEALQERSRKFMAEPDEDDDLIVPPRKPPFLSGPY